MGKKEPVYVSSPAPIDDGGRKYNVITLAAVAIGAVLGLAFGGPGGLAICTLMGAMLGYITEATIVKVKWYGLREMKFGMGRPVEKAVLFQRLVQGLTPMGMTVEMNTDGTPVINYQTLIYEINLNEDQTFTIWWRKSLARAFFSIDILTVIPNYRKAVVAMGIIAYHIQQISMEQVPANTGAQLPSMEEPSNQPQMEGIPSAGSSVSGPQVNPVPAAARQPEKKKSPVKIIGIAAAAVVVLGIGIAALSGSGEEMEPTSQKPISEADHAQTDGSNQKMDISAYDLYEALQENDAFTYTLNDKMSEFLQSYDGLFPAASKEALLAEGVVDEGLEARQILKNPDRYGDKLMFLPELQVVQIIETEMDTDQYLTEINAADMMGQSYYIIYNGVLDDIFENDWISAYALPLGATTYENIEGGETWTIPMAGSYVENMNEEMSGEAAAIPTGQEQVSVDPSVMEYFFPSSLEAECSWSNENGYFMIPFTSEGQPLVAFSVANNTIEANVIYYGTVTAAAATEYGGLAATVDVYTNSSEGLWNGTVEIRWDSMESVDHPVVTMINGTEMTDTSIAGNYTYYGMTDDGNSTAAAAGGSFQADWIYGSYEVHSGYLDASAEVGFNSGDGTDYLFLSGATPDGSAVGEFYGVVTANDGRNGQAADEYGNVISFYYNGVDTLEITDSTGGALGGMNFPGFSGTYQKTADLSMNAG